MKDPRTLSNTSHEEIIDLAVESRNRAEWTKAQRMKNVKEIACTTCTTAFLPKRHWQRFCSADCRIAHFKHNNNLERLQLLAEIEVLKKRIKELEDSYALDPNR